MFHNVGTHGHIVTTGNLTFPFPSSPYWSTTLLAVFQVLYSWTDLNAHQISPPPFKMYKAHLKKKMITWLIFIFLWFYHEDCQKLNERAIWNNCEHHFPYQSIYLGTILVNYSFFKANNVLLKYFSLLIDKLHIPEWAHYSDYGSFFANEDTWLYVPIHNFFHKQNYKEILRYSLILINTINAFIMIFYFIKLYFSINMDSSFQYAKLNLLFHLGHTHF